jgi:hypothetical protein
VVGVIDKKRAVVVAVEIAVIAHKHNRHGTTGG